MEVKTSVMSDMRRFVTLFIQFRHDCRRLISDRSVDVTDMINRDEFPSLESAILHVTSSSDQAPIKSGLKLGLYYLLKKLAKVIKIYYLVKKQDELALEVDKVVIRWESSWILIEFVWNDPRYCAQIHILKHN